MSLEDERFIYHPGDIQVAAAAAAAPAAHAHANGGGDAVSLTWNGQAVDLATVELGGYLPPHLPAGTPQGGQFGITSGAGTNSGGTAGKTPAQQHALHLAHIAHLQHLVATGKATPAQKAELAGLLKAAGTTGTGTAAAGKLAVAAKAGKAKAAPKPKAKKPSAPGKPVVNKAKGTVTTTIGGKKVTMTLHQWHVLHVAHLAREAKLAAGDSGRFLDLAVSDAIAVPDPALRRQAAPPSERVPPGVPAGGQYAPRPAQLTCHDTPQRAAAVINGMGPLQRAAVRSTALPPPGFQWRPGDRLEAAQ